MEYKRLFLALVLCLTLGIMPYDSEPHLVGKLRWLAGGGVGMDLLDYWDLVMHGAPWLYLGYVSVVSFIQKHKKG